MTRKKLVIIIVCAVILLALCIAGGYYALSFIKHPAFTHDDYVYGNKLVIDNETPFEYDAELADRNPYPYPIIDSTLAQVQYYFGNKILREKDGYLYTVYSSPDNNLLYVFFTQSEDGTWMLDRAIRTSMVYIHDELMQEIYEHDAPQIILDGNWPTKTIDNQKANARIEGAANSLYTIRYNLGLTDIRQLVAEETYAQAYRLTVDVSFGGLHYIDFYVHHDGTGTLIYKRYYYESTIKPNPTFEDVTYTLSSQETSSLLRVWETQDFFSLPSTHMHEEVDSLIMDGEYIYLEGINYVTKFEKSGTVSIYDYHMSRVHDTRINFPQFWAIYNAMIAMVESKGTEVRFNMTHQEEELRVNQNN
ncbi:MAG: hypothetical protein IJY27_02710 [Clostridia bacterium]|nr:hypothetical protein [Clostridia bacterium]